MELVTGFTGEPHITPEQDADLYRGVIGIDSYVLPVGRQLEHEVETVNKIVVNDGVLMLQGREMSIEAGHQDEYTIENGIQGENRIDLIGIRYTVDPDTGKESVSHETIKGESVAGNPTDPTFTTGDIRGEGAIDVFFPLYSVRLTGLTISAVVKRFSVTKSVTDLEEYIDTQKGRIDTLNASLEIKPLSWFAFSTGVTANSASLGIAISLPNGKGQIQIENKESYGMYRVDLQTRTANNDAGSSYLVCVQATGVSITPLYEGTDTRAPRLGVSNANYLRYYINNDARGFDIAVNIVKFR